jgi:4-aminobutyrate aminotransferase-like enzyme
MHSDGLLQRRFRLLGRAAQLFYERPIHLVRGEGVWVFDADGRRYLDAYNNVPHVGHCHPRVVEALCRQAKTLNLSTRYLDETILRYGERLTATFDASLSMVVFCCSGTEANELALRIAKTCTGGTGVIVTDFCYHGNSSTIAELSTAYPGPEGISPKVRTFAPPDLYRLRAGVDAAGAAEAYARDVQAALDSFAAQGIRPAALLVDTLFSVEGLPHVPAGFLEKAVAQVRAAGGLFIADEVQPGFGRTGEAMWGYQLYDVVPDLVTLGKPMGNGHPLAGVVGRPALIEAFGGKAMYFNTFGGNPVSCAVGLAVLEVIADEGLIENARRVGKHLKDGLVRLAARYDIIGDLKGCGLFLGAELVRDRAIKAPAPEATRAVINGMRERGVLVAATGRRDVVLKIRPPMPFSLEHADLLLATLDDTLQAL